MVFIGTLVCQQQQLANASSAFAHAYQFAPQNGDILMNYAEVLSLQNNDHITNQAAKMLQEILILQPDNDAARNLLAIYAYQQKDYQIAINYWKKILPHYLANSADGQTISQAIAKVQKLINAAKKST